jgi:hypothetical protein
MKPLFYLLPLLALLLFEPLTVGAQATYEFGYDANGNMTQKRKLLLNLRQGNEEKKSLDIDGKYTLNAYPNPVKEQLTLEIGGLGEDSKASFIMYDLNGVEVRRNDKLQSSNVVRFDDLGSGVYIIKMLIAGKPVDVKVIKEM